MITIEVPGHGSFEFEHLVSDYTGTLSVDGRLLPGVKDLLVELSRQVKVHFVTSDTFGTAREELAGIDCVLRIIDGEEHDAQKEAYVQGLGPDRVVALGNGNNDSRMLRLAKLGIAVVQGEGCATAAILASDIVVNSAKDGLGLLINPKRTKATLRI